MTRASYQLDERTVNQTRNTSKNIDTIVEVMIVGAAASVIGGAYNNETVVNTGLVLAGISTAAMAVVGAKEIYRLIRGDL